MQAAVGSLPPPMRSHIRYWIAGPTRRSAHRARLRATQWYWGSKDDISTANPDFKPPLPLPLPAGAGAAASGLRQTAWIGQSAAVTGV